MTSQYSALDSGNRLKIGDYLISPNGYFKGIMQTDDNFCIYAKDIFCWATDTTGGHVQDKIDTYLCLDNTGMVYILVKGRQIDMVYQVSERSGCKPGQQGSYQLRLLDDGNLFVYKGSDVFFRFGDPVETIIAIKSMDYDIAKAVKDPSQEIELCAEVTFENDSDIEQKKILEYNKTITRTYKWSVEVGVKVAVETTIGVTWPFIAGGGIKVSAEASSKYSQETTTTESITFKDSTNIAVPPRSIIKAIVLISRTTIHVPYKLTGTVRFKSGRTVENYTESGTYTGSNAHDLYVKVKQTDLKTNNVTNKTIPLTQV